MNILFAILSGAINPQYYCQYLENISIPFQHLSIRRPQSSMVHTSELLKMFRFACRIHDPEPLNRLMLKTGCWVLVGACACLISAPTCQMLSIFFQYLEMLRSIPQHQYLVVSESIFNDFLTIEGDGAARAKSQNPGMCSDGTTEHRVNSPCTP